MGSSDADNPNPPSSRPGPLGWTPPSVEEVDALIPGKYEVLELLGAGGMAAVYKARQKALNRLVAIKILPATVAGDNAEFNFAERFKHEAQAMANLNHPGIVAVHDFGEAELPSSAGSAAFTSSDSSRAEGASGCNVTLLYFVMEYIDGMDIVAYLREHGGKLPEEYALTITAHVLDALAYAHDHGIIHRDIKPANVLINSEGQVKIADFGLAKHSAAPASAALTRTNITMGTPDFVAPEALITGAVVDHRADLYAVGVMLYQMLTGELPRGRFQLPAEKNPALDRRIDPVVDKAMASDPDLRYQSAAEMRAAVDELFTQPVAKVTPDAPSTAIPVIPKKATPPGATEPAGKGGPPGAKIVQEKEGLGGAAKPRAEPTSSKKSVYAAVGTSAGLALIGALLWVVVANNGGKSRHRGIVPGSPPDTELQPAVTDDIYVARPELNPATPGRLRGWGSFQGDSSLRLESTAGVEDFVRVQTDSQEWVAVRKSGEGWLSGRKMNPPDVGYLSRSSSLEVLTSRGETVEIWPEDKNRKHFAGDFRAQGDRLVVTARRNGDVQWPDLALRKRIPNYSPPSDDSFSLGHLKEISATHNWACFLQNDGTLRVWEFRNGSERQMPDAFHDIVEIEGGANHVLGLKKSGTVVADAAGKFADKLPDMLEIVVPNELGPFKAIRAGGNMSAAQRLDGTWVAWGRDEKLIKKVAEIGHASDLDLTSFGGENDGAAYVLWIDPVTPILADTPPSPPPNQKSPFPLPIPKRPETGGKVVVWRLDGKPVEKKDGITDVPSDLDQTVQLATENNPYPTIANLLALDADGKVTVWGDRSEDSQRNHARELTPPPDAVDLVRIQGATGFACGLRSDGTLIAWGNDDQRRASPPSFSEPVADFAIVGNRGYALTQSGKVFQWGSRGRADHQHSVPPDLLPAKSVFAAFVWEGVVLADGSVRLWGGHESEVILNAPPSLQARTLTGGYHYAFAVLPSGQVTAWGDKNQLGKASEIERTLEGITTSRHQGGVNAARLGEDAWLFWKNPNADETLNIEYNEKMAKGCTDLVFAAPYVLAIKPETSSPALTSNQLETAATSRPPKLPASEIEEPGADATVPEIPELRERTERYEKAKGERFLALTESYAGAIDREIAAASKAGDPEAVVALRAEKIGLEKKEPLPETDPPDLHPKLGGLRATYRAEIDKIEAELLGDYRKSLNFLVTDLTQKGRAEDALAVKKFRQSLGTTAPPRPERQENTAITPPAGTNSAMSPASATKEKPFENSLGMCFVPVPITGGPTDGKRILFSVWETRVADYEKFIRDDRDRPWPEPDFRQKDDHPAVMVSWEDVVAFCAWLTEEERKKGLIGKDEVYRLPTDHEWSCAVGIGDQEDADLLPVAKQRKLSNVYPWGDEWPPPKGAGNYYGKEAARNPVDESRKPIEGYDDGFERTTPVGSFAPNEHGLYDLSGNVCEWCEDWYSGDRKERVRRGGSWNDNDRDRLLSSFRYYASSPRNAGGGFRCVLATSAGNAVTARPGPVPKAETGNPEPETATKSPFPLPLPKRPTVAGKVIAWRLDGKPLEEEPEPVAQIPADIGPAVSIMAQIARVAVLEANGGVKVWGAAAWEPAERFTDAVSIDPTYLKTVVLRQDGSVFVGGERATTNHRKVTASWSNITNALACNNDIFALRNDGVLLLAEHGGSTIDWTPLLSEFASKRWIDIATNDMSLFGLSDSGTVYHWDSGNKMREYEIDGAKDLFRFEGGIACLTNAGTAYQLSRGEASIIPEARGSQPLKNISRLTGNRGYSAALTDGEWEFSATNNKTIDIRHCEKMAEGCTDLVIVPPYVLAIKP